MTSRLRSTSSSLTRSGHQGDVHEQEYPDRDFARRGDFGGYLRPGIGGVTRIGRRPCLVQLLRCAKDAVNPAFCKAVRGDRAEGWMAQGRSEVMARNGMVTTSQPLAAEAGLEILRKGGNAVDAAVATAAVLNLVEPMNVGMAGDLFAIIYTAKDHKLHVLNASGMAASGQTLAFMNSPWLQIRPPAMTVPARAWRMASCR